MNLIASNFSEEGNDKIGCNGCYIKFIYCVGLLYRNCQTVFKRLPIEHDFFSENFPKTYNIFKIGACALRECVFHVFFIIFKEEKIQIYDRIHTCPTLFLPKI